MRPPYHPTMTTVPQPPRGVTFAQVAVALVVRGSFAAFAAPGHADHD